MTAELECKLRERCRGEQHYVVQEIQVIEWVVVLHVRPSRGWLEQPLKNASAVAKLHAGGPVLFSALIISVSQ